MTAVFRLVVEDNRQSFPDRGCPGSIGLPDLDHLPRRVSILTKCGSRPSSPSRTASLFRPARNVRIASEELFVRGGPETEHLFHLFEIGLRPLPFPPSKARAALAKR